MIDTREQAPLVFPETKGVTVERKFLQVGDYSAYHDLHGLDPTIFERKGIGDLFNSFTSNYDAERKKIQCAKDLGYSYILAIEGSVSDILAGYRYRKGGQEHEHKKSGLAMLRQLCTIERKYGLHIWFCTSRTEMAWRIQEYFLSHERIQPDASTP